jgi:chemotaxis protein methyltransferase CheR
VVEPIHRLEDPQLTDAEFRMFANLLREHCGLNFTSETRFLLEKRLTRRLRELGLTSFAAYHYHLRSSAEHAGDLANLIDEVTTNETYFFRQRVQLRALVGELFTELLAEREASGGGPILVWSAGCSSGEEPYSIVVLATEAGFVPGRDFRVYASDISRRMLRKARLGLYREASFRETEPELRERYFTGKDRLWRISDDVKRHVDFVRLNLMDRSAISLLGTMDVVLCRNVMIYFDQDSRRRVIQTFHEKLKPGGHLLLGSAESLVHLSTAFETRHLSEDMVYRRPISEVYFADPRNRAALDVLVEKEDAESAA